MSEFVSETDVLPDWLAVNEPEPLIPDLPVIESVPFPTLGIEAEEIF